MKKRTKISVALSVFLILGVVASAAYASTWTPSEIVHRIEVWEDDEILLTGFDNVAGCFLSGIIFEPDSSDPDMVLDMALTAMASGKKLACAVDGCYSVQIGPSWYSFQKGLRCYLRD